MAETQLHLDQIVYLLLALQQFFAAAPDVFVAADLLVYYVQGDPKRRVAPDVFVARGVVEAKRLRRTYLVWEEGVPPEVVMEVTSRGTRREDTVTKRALYESLGVHEYFLFQPLGDPIGEYLHPRLQGYRLYEGRYQAIEPTQDGGLHSDVLGLDFRLRPDQVGGLRLYDPVAGRWLPGPHDEVAARRQAEAQRDAEASARRAAEAELERLRALLRQRGEENGRPHT